MLAFKNLKINQRQSFDRVKRRYFNAAQDIQEVSTISEEIVRKLLIEEKENLSDDDNDAGGSRQFSSNGHISAKNLLKRTYKGNASLNLESSKPQYYSDAASPKPINNGPALAVDRLQLYVEFYKEYNIDEIAKLYQNPKKPAK